MQLAAKLSGRSRPCSRQARRPLGLRWARAAAMSSLARVMVTVSGVLPAPIDRVWPLVRDFGNISKWLRRVGSQRVDSELLVSPPVSLAAPQRVCSGCTPADPAAWMWQLRQIHQHTRWAWLSARLPFPLASAGIEYSLSWRAAQSWQAT